MLCFLLVFILAQYFIIGRIQWLIMSLTENIVVKNVCNYHNNAYGNL